MVNFRRLRLQVLNIKYLWYLIVPWLLIVGLRDNGVVAQLNRYGFDRLLALRPSEPLDDRIVIVTIDREDLGQEPEPERNIISDQNLAQVIDQLAAAQPSVIGVDIVRDGSIDPDLTAAYRRHPMTVGLTSIQEKEAVAPSGVTPDRAGFGDYEPDEDSLVRRALLASFDPPMPQYSFAFLVAQKYLKQRGKAVTVTPQALRIAGKSIAPLSRNNSTDKIFEMLVNYRHAYPSFRQVSWTEILQGKIPDLRGKVVLIGYIAAIKQDFVNTSVFWETPQKVKGNITGVEYHGHIASQLIATGLGQRNIIQPVPAWVHYIWLLGCLLGNGLVFKVINFKYPFWILVIVFFTYIAGVCLGIYLLFLAGWWLSVGLTSILLIADGPLRITWYQKEQAMRETADRRQQTITEAFNAIHNGPLQELSLLRQAIQSQELSMSTISERLEKLNQQIRQVGESLQANGTSNSSKMLVLGNGELLDLQIPLNELLHLVADRVLYYETHPQLTHLKIRVISFQAVPNEKNLSLDQKRQICQFLEEAIGNVAKYADRSTKLQLLGTVQRNIYRLSIEDNGGGILSDRAGVGTQQAQELAATLQGSFSRIPNKDANGVCCTIEWPLPK